MAAVPAADEAALIDLNTPPQSDTSPFNFGPPAANAEIAAPAPSKGRSGLVLALCGLAAGFLLALIFVVSFAANSDGKKSAATESSPTPTAPPSGPAKPETPVLRYEEKLLLDCIRTGRGSWRWSTFGR